MSVGLTIAIRAVPFLDLLDEEVESLASDLAGMHDTSTDSVIVSRMDTSRRRLAQAIDAFVRSLPSAIRNDSNTTRATAYALVGLADERMLHHPGRGMGRWRERLLEFDLYGSALAGQEIVSRARASTYGATEEAGSGRAGDSALLAPLYLGMFRAGFEGGLRGDSDGLSALVASLEDTVGTSRRQILEVGAGTRPKLVGVSPPTLMFLGLVVWLTSGIGLWLTLQRDAQLKADYMAARVSAGLPADLGMPDPLERSIGPSGLPSFRLPLLLPRDSDRADRDAGAVSPSNGQ